MLILATGSLRKARSGAEKDKLVASWRSEAGFSLVETMVVVAIIGLMAGAVVLSVPSRDTALEDALATSQQAFTALGRQSVLTGEVLGVRFSADGFKTYRLTDEGWKPAPGILKPGVEQFRPLTLLSLQVDGEAQTFDLKEGEPFRPHVWFLPTGEQPAFTIALDDGINRGMLTADDTGTMTVTRDG